MKRTAISFILAAICFLACEDDQSTAADPDYVIGKNYFTTIIDGDMREYYVHVPESYDNNTATPLVLFLHGGSGTGLTSYNSSGWKEVGDEYGIITAFPTSWSYCWIRANGSRNDTTRWNSFPGIFEFCPGEVPRDDVKFLRNMIDEVSHILNVDERKIYMAGLSSGGQMSFRCAVEMTDILAAVVQVAGTHQKDTILNPIRNLPIAFEVGNMDDTWFDIFPPLSLFDTLLKTYVPFRNVIEAHVKTFHYDTTYILSGNESSMTANFPSRPNGENREFLFTLIDKLEHEYPNTVNHPIHGAKLHWQWMRQFSLN